MTTPPPPPPSNPPQPPGGGGGFGPPQGFGPPPGQQPPPFGQQPPQDQPGYGQGQPGHGQGQGFGPYGPYGQQPMPPGPPAPSGGNGAKIAAIVVAVVLVVGLAVGGVIYANRGGKSEPVAKSSPSPASASPSDSASPSPADSPSLPGPGGGGIPSRDVNTPSPSTTPLINLKIGECFDHPSMTPSVTKVEKKSCNGTHDGEVVATETLDGPMGNDSEIKEKALGLCKADAQKKLNSIGDGKRYYYFALYPTKLAFLIRGERTVACSLTRSDSPGGAKLTEPLP